MSWIEAKVSGKWINADLLNPYRRKGGGRPQRRPKGPVSEAENRAAWKLLDTYFGGGRKKR